MFNHHLFIHWRGKKKGREKDGGGKKEEKNNRGKGGRKEMKEKKEGKDKRKEPTNQVQLFRCFEHGKSH